MIAKTEHFDVVTLELVKNAISSVLNDMALSMMVTSFSRLCREIGDFTTGLVDTEGNIFGEGLTNPGHSGAFPIFIGAIKKAWGDEIYPGDVFMCNDPYEGGAHLPDIHVAKPIFIDGKLEAFAGAIAHQLDMGGRVAGSNACDNTEIYQEGLRIPPLKYLERGIRNHTLYRLIQKNVRVSHMVLGDIEAQVNALAIGEREFLKLAEKYGWQTLRRYLNELMDYSERMTRASIRALPDGIYEGEDFLDDDGFSDKPVKLHVKIIVDGDNLMFDFTGSSPTVRGSINCDLPTTIGIVDVAMRLLIDPAIPSNGGVWRPVKVIAPKDTVVNVGFPAGLAGRGCTVGRILDCIKRALVKLAPDKVNACTASVDFGISMSGIDMDGKPFICTDFPMGSWGARPWADGISANTCLWLNFSNVPCEVMEADHPVRLERYSFIPDTGGAGKYRGGLAMVKDYRILVDNVNVQWRQDRAVFPPWGVQGGKDGTLAEGYHITPGGEKRKLKKSIFVANKGDLLRAILPGAGGFGNPFERDIDKVLEDVRNEVVSAEAAKRDYGVVIDEETMVVNLEETKKLREAALKGEKA